MAIVTGDRYLESLVNFVDRHAEPLIDGNIVLKLNPVGLHYVQSRLEALAELENLLSGAPVDYLRAYVSDLGDHRALEQLRRILKLLTSLKVVSVLPTPCRDPTPLSLLPFGRLKVLELRGCDISTSAARGLLELRLTLEKIVCHNSTDALRHVFASRIADIKDSPQWNRLSFVSCACNGLVLMDESLQLLPAVETLDLSRNKFAKVDNLQRCTKLNHLDLGFNHLRTIASFSKISCQIVKLVLRNNALTTLRGIEKLKSIEELDLSYNIISNFVELEVLSGLSSLQNLWLEGNPLCSANWYRAQVFSIFPCPEKLKLDDKNIFKREFWKRQIIIASRHKQPASFGFYSPAKDGADVEGSINTKRKRRSRLVSIKSEEKSTIICSDDDSESIDGDQTKQENDNLDEATEIVDLMNKIELMKKEHSVMWLEELKDWINQGREDAMGLDSNTEFTVNSGRESYSNKRREKHFGETSSYVCDLVQTSGVGCNRNNLKSDNPLADVCDQSGELHLRTYAGNDDKDMPINGNGLKQGHLQFYNHEGVKLGNASNSFFDSAARGGQGMISKNDTTPSAVIDDIIDSYSSACSPSSPPHYQDDILHRLQNMEEGYLQRSIELYSVSSSDSNTSYSGDDSVEDGYATDGQSVVDSLGSHVESQSFVLNSENSFYDKRQDISLLIENGTYQHDQRTFGNSGHKESDSFDESFTNFPAEVNDGDIVHPLKHGSDWLEKRTSKKKLKKRVISLTAELNNDLGTEAASKLNGHADLETCVDELQDTHVGQVSPDSKFHMMGVEIDYKRNSVPKSSTHASSKKFSGMKSSAFGMDELILDYFKSNLADCAVQETCRQYMHCSCMLEANADCKERDVALLLSSQKKLYILLLEDGHIGSGSGPGLVGCHRTEDVKDILVGLALQVIRVHIEAEVRYLFITGSIETSRQLLCMVGLFDENATEDKLSLKSLEQVQVSLFESHVCGGARTNIFLYSILQFWHNNLEVGQWLSRSLFVLGGDLLLCTEDLSQFGSASEDVSPYFSLDLCFCVIDALEMVIETGESFCVTLALRSVTSKFQAFLAAAKMRDETSIGGSPGLPCSTWKLKWSSEESLSNFVALFKALHAAAATTPLIVRHAQSR